MHTQQSLMNKNSWCPANWWICSIGSAAHLKARMGLQQMTTIKNAIRVTTRLQLKTKQLRSKTAYNWAVHFGDCIQLTKSHVGTSSPISQSLAHDGLALQYLAQEHRRTTQASLLEYWFTRLFDKPDKHLRLDQPQGHVYLSDCIRPTCNGDGNKC